MAEWREVTTKESFKIKNGIGLKLSLVTGTNNWAGHGHLFLCNQFLSKEDEHFNDFFLYFGLYLYVFSKDDVAFLRFIDSSDKFCRYFMKFKDGKAVIIIAPVTYPDKTGLEWIHNYSLEFEYYFGDLLFQEADTSKRCPNCGAPITNDMDFCGECGRKLK